MNKWITLIQVLQQVILCFGLVDTIPADISFQPLEQMIDDGESEWQSFYMSSFKTAVLSQVFGVRGKCRVDYRYKMTKCGTAAVGLWTWNLFFFFFAVVTFWLANLLSQFESLGVFMKCAHTMMKEAHCAMIWTRRVNY